MGIDDEYLEEVGQRRSQIIQSNHRNSTEMPYFYSITYRVSINRNSSEMSFSVMELHYTISYNVYYLSFLDHRGCSVQQICKIANLDFELILESFLIISFKKIGQKLSIGINTSGKVKIYKDFLHLITFHGQKQTLKRELSNSKYLKKIMILFDN